METQLLENAEFEQNISNTFNQLDQATMARLLVELDVQSLKEKINFLKATHNASIEMLQETLHLIDVSQFYRIELTRCIADIKNDLEALAQCQRHELECYYRTKTEDVRENIANIDDTDKQSYAKLYVSFHETIAEINNLTNEYNIKSETMTTLQSNLENLQHGIVASYTTNRIL